MDDEFEKHMKKCNNMSSVRKMAESSEASACGSNTSTSAIINTSAAIVANAFVVNVVEDASAVVVADACAADVIFASSSVLGTACEPAFYLFMMIMYMHLLILLW